MSFIRSWAPFFLSRDRMRGRSYHEDGRVEQIATQRDELVRAKVQGSTDYIVTIRRDGGSADVTCTCPRFESGSYCKHIWATLLEAKERGSPIDQVSPRPPKARKRTDVRPQMAQEEAQWTRQLSMLRPSTFGTDDSVPVLLSVQHQVCYIVGVNLSQQHHGLVINLHQRRPSRKGWTKLRRLKINSQIVQLLPDPIDRELCALLLGAARIDGYDLGNLASNDRARATFLLPDGAQRSLLRRIIQTERAFVRNDRSGHADIDDPLPLVWDGDGKSHADPWVLWLTGTQTDQELSIRLELRRETERMSIERPILLLGGKNGVAIWDGKVAPFDDCDAFRWADQFRTDGEAKDHLQIPEEDVDRFLDQLYRLPELPQIELPEQVARTEQDVDPVPHLDLFKPSAMARPHTQLAARIWFAYGDKQVKPGQPGRFIQNSTDDQVTLIRRNRRRENDALAPLDSLGFRPNRPARTDPFRGPSLLSEAPDTTGEADHPWRLPIKQMSAVVAQLLHQGWVVNADSKAVRGAGIPRLSATSGIDWFELRGQFHYETDQGTEEVSLPTILEAARAGRPTVQLGDGSEGLLPEQWLASHGLFVAAGSLEGDHLRYESNQTALLDALLSQQEYVDVDAKLEAARRRLSEFRTVTPLDPESSFVGTLRPYQRDGLGWLLFLRWFEMGGVLADDMGLGKTVQVLAFLDRLYNGTLEHEEAKQGRPQNPSLIVVPRSVVFNWIDESARFTPNLRVHAYTGTERQIQRESFDDHHLIVTSYGLMRRDIEHLVEHRFEYAILDEAQAIKNPSSQSAKSARLLPAKHRLALTGTPVENHLGDLWSILEFLNPGILGSGTRFMQLVRDGIQSPLNVTAAEQAARALRPFILRRTKQQVLADLPDKTEQTIHCEMEPEQREIYDTLRTHYRQTLLKTIPTGDGVGMGRSTMMVLEALLRLRQAACHPALIDPQRPDLPSAKMDVLLDQLTELIDEGHKALVFSQFTSMLALVRRRLDAAGIVYEYLDGKTRDRKSCIDRFQTDPACPVFLISLKAGGLGLNLTAAEYVFILDPWWNPAVEAQAIDRAHRIGQTQHVFAYRLICQDTVEQRIVELQEKKKKLADAIVGGQENLLRTLTRDDLEQLLR